jgi:hypothetical protein
MMQKTSSQSDLGACARLNRYYSAFLHVLIVFTSKITKFDVALIWNKCSDVIIAGTKDSKRSTRQFPWEVPRAFADDSAQGASPKHHSGKNLVHNNPSPRR